MALIGLSDPRELLQSLESSRGSSAFSIQSLCCLLYKESCVEVTSVLSSCVGGFREASWSQEDTSVPGALARLELLGRKARYVWGCLVFPACSLCSETKGCRQCSCDLAGRP